MNRKKRYNYVIMAQDIDFQKHVSLASLSGFIFNTAGYNATENGFGLLELQEYNYTWVVSRFVVDMVHIPKEKEHLGIETWIEDVGRAFTNRNFTITDKDNKVIGYASTSWAIIDMKTRQPALLDTLPELRSFIVPESTPIGLPSRIPNMKGDVVNTFEVKYSNLDVNRHANSLYYIHWLSDCFSLDFYLTHSLKRFEINFLKELVFGDIGYVFMQMKEENDYYFQIVTRDKGVACRARMLFEDR